MIDAAARETFTPPPAGVSPTLTAAQAWRAEQLRRPGHHKLRPIPAGVDAQLGVLTLPPQVTDVLAWGYRHGPLGCIYTGIYHPTPLPKCFYWTFVQASNGRFLDSTEQEVSLVHATPTPIPTERLLQDGFIDGVASRFAPDGLEYQAPESVIRWTFDETHCRVKEHWFEPVLDDASPTRAACPWRHRFTVDLVARLTGQGHDFEVVAGHQPHRSGEYVRATLADGTTSVYPSDTDATWIFVVQRCGQQALTARLTHVDLIAATSRRVIATLPVRSPRIACAI